MGINLRRVLTHDEAAEMVKSRFQALQVEPQLPYSVQVAKHLISVKVNDDANHWWSPEMNLRLEAHADHSKLYEVIGPNPPVFTLAMFFILLGSVTFLAALMMALSLMYLGNSPTWALIATLISLLVVGSALAGLAVGRIKAAEQVCELRNFAESVLQSERDAPAQNHS